MAARAVTQVQSQAEQPTYDPIFFPKEAIKKGTQLTCYGRRDPLSEWVVVRIETYVRTPKRLFRLEPVDEVIKLSDVVHLERRGTADGFVATRRSPTFGSLSYSAIWRLKQ